MAGLREVEKLLRKHGKARIWAHSLEVAAAAVRIAGAYGLDAEQCETASLCHDIGGIMTPEAMRMEAERRGMALDPAEAMHPFLLHQRFSKALCEERLGIEDALILSAVGCHTTLKPSASALDMAVFLADKLAWDQPGEPPFGSIIEEALHTSLERASLAYIDYVLARGMILMPHRWLLEARAWLIPFSACS